MDFIKEINAFEQWLETNHLPATTQLLWYKLFMLFNKSGWAEWIQVDNLRLMSLIGVSEKTLIERRNDLIKANLIEYKKGRKGSNGKYKLNSFCTGKITVHTTVYPTVQPTVEATVYPTVEPSALYKQNKTKLNDNKKNNKKKYGEHNNVLLTDEEVEKLKERFPADWESWIETLSEGLALKGYKYKSHYLAILNWAKRDNKPVHSKPTKFSDYSQTGEYDFEEIERRALEKRLGND